MKKKKPLVSFVIMVVIAYVCGLGIQYALGSVEFNFKLFYNLNTLTYSAVVLAVILLWYLVNMKPSNTNTADKKTREGKTKDGSKLSQYSDSRWITEDELKNESKFRFYLYKDLAKCKNDGIVIRSELRGNNLLINMYKPIHTLVIGTTGSGKTQCYVNPTIQILSSCGSKPSMIISDPKGELLSNHYNKFKKEGYDIKVLDLRNPYKSTRWNPMDKSYVAYMRAVNLEKEVKKYVDVAPSQIGLKLIDESYGKEWYGFNGNAYSNIENLKSDMRSLKAQLINQAENDLREIALALCPVEDKNSPGWERGAQDLLTGTLIAMLEDCTIPETGMTREKFNLYNMAQIVNTKNMGDDPFEDLKDYFAGRPVTSKAMSLASTVITNAPTTMRSFMGVVTTATALFQDDGINYLTSYNDMDFSNFANKPTVLFVEVPDERKARHPMATLCISQLYQILIEMANRTAKLELPRNVYFVLDEFANLPKLNNFSEQITVGRSRRIFFSLVVQSYSQLDGKYGEQDAATIRGNCNIQIYIGSDDQKTKESFSKMCGDVSIEMEKKSSSKDKDGKSQGDNLSKEVIQRPLIYPDELGHVPQGEAIVKIFNEYPMRNKFTFSYKVPQFDMTPMKETYVVSHSLDVEAIRYDIVARNRKMVKKNTDFEDFF